MIVVTGAAGFIGSCLISELNTRTSSGIVAVDDFGTLAKNRNLVGKDIERLIHRDDFHGWLSKSHAEVEFIFHLGARTDTAETDEKIFDFLNLNYSKKLWDLCVSYQIPLIYASSAATYGLGEHGYDDTIDNIHLLKPLNEYGRSKQKFDEWVINHQKCPPFWYGFKFFNVFGPNEYHKDRMASVVLHAYNQISTSGKLNLFRSHNPAYMDGHQSRDFIYVKDVIEVLFHFYMNKPDNGIYNLGSGTARPFLDLASVVFSALDKSENIAFIDTPADIREKYQYCTKALMEKVKNAGYLKSFTPLEEAVKDYVVNYLCDSRFF